jgi:poly(3-hydroxybutyrate) depolymerase
MLYRAYQAYADSIAPVRSFAGAATRLIDSMPAPLHGSPLARNLSGSYQMLSRAGLSHVRPAFGIDRVRVAGEDVPVTEEIALDLPFGSLVHFAKDAGVAQPKVLLVAPLSGHFATLLRATVNTMSRDHDVYLTDWHNARDVSLAHGSFGFEDYVDYLIRFLRHLGPDAHMVAVCQPCVAALAATAVLAEGHDDVTPRSLTLMAGPIDARISPTRVNDLATSKPLSWFERNVIATVPHRYAGWRRSVYPGFLQLGAFVSMNPTRHLKAHYELYGDLVNGAVAKADATKTFYDEYFSVLDMPAEFYLETVERVFQTFDLARGALTHHGRPVDPTAIHRTALLTVEGERDDICAVGQTMAAHDLATRVPAFRRRHHLQPGVGHYGVFSGSRWERQIYPVVRQVIQANT